MDWKEQYKYKWKEGNKREKLFLDFMKVNKLCIEKNGFGCLQNQYLIDIAEEKGIPDFKSIINNEEVFFEVTGTSLITDKKQNIWIRPDKIKYANDNNLKLFFVHILDKINLMRFINYRDITKNNSELIFPKIRGIEEKYCSIDPKIAFSCGEFLKLIKSEMF